MRFQGLKQLIGWATRVGNHNFCPGFDWMIDWLKHPLGWVVTAILFSLLVGLMIGPQGYVLASAFLALLLLGMAWPWISMRGVRCHLVLPDRQVTENQELMVVFRVKNYWPLPVIGLMVKGDFLQTANEGDEPIAFSLNRVPAWSEAEFRIPMTPRRRGHFPTGDVVAACGFPFGLIDIPKPISHSPSIRVWPACNPLDGLPIADSTRFTLTGKLRDRAGNEGDSIGVRSFREGDRLRNIHWAQSVRSQNLMVRERQTIASTEAIVDLSPADHRGHGTESSFEWAIRIAASICNHLNDARSPVRLVCLGLDKYLGEQVGKQFGERKFSSVDNQRGPQAIMDFLADLPALPEAAACAQRAAELQSPTSCGRSLARDGRLFMIGSNRSQQFQNAQAGRFASNLIPVILNVDSTQNDEQTRRATLPQPESFVATGQRTCERETIVVASDQLGTADWVSAWSGSFSDAV